MLAAVVCLCERYANCEGAPCFDVPFAAGRNVTCVCPMMTYEGEIWRPPVAGAGDVTTNGYSPQWSYGSSSGDGSDDGGGGGGSDDDGGGGGSDDGGGERHSSEWPSVVTELGECPLSSGDNAGIGCATNAQVSTSFRAFALRNGWGTHAASPERGRKDDAGQLLPQPRLVVCEAHSRTCDATPRRDAATSRWTGMRALRA